MSEKKPPGELAPSKVYAYLAALVGTENAWRTSAEIADALADGSSDARNDVAKVLWQMVRQGRILRRARAGTLHREVMAVVQEPKLKARSPKAARAEIPAVQPTTIAVDVACQAADATVNAVVSGPLEDSFGKVAGGAAMEQKPPLSFRDLVERMQGSQPAAPGPFEIPHAGVVTLPEPEPAVFEPEGEDAITEEMHRINAACVANIITNLGEKLHALRTVSGLFSGRFEASRTARVLDEIAADLERVAGAA